MGELGEGDQKVQTSSCKISSRDVTYSMVTVVVNNFIYFKVVKRVNLKSSHHKEKNL